MTFPQDLCFVEKTLLFIKILVDYFFLLKEGGEVEERVEETGGEGGQVEVRVDERKESVSLF